MRRRGKIGPGEVLAGAVLGVVGWALMALGLALLGYGPSSTLFGVPCDVIAMAGGVASQGSFVLAQFFWPQDPPGEGKRS